jgi:hypothetical protein
MGSAMAFRSNQDRRHGLACRGCKPRNYVQFVGSHVKNPEGVLAADVICLAGSKRPRRDKGQMTGMLNMTRAKSRRSRAIEVVLMHGSRVLMSLGRLAGVGVVQASEEAQVIGVVEEASGANLAIGEVKGLLGVDQEAKVAVVGAGV